MTGLQRLASTLRQLAKRRDLPTIERNDLMWAAWILEGPIEQAEARANAANLVCPVHGDRCLVSTCDACDPGKQAKPFGVVS